MFSVPELRYAQKYPFSALSRKIVEQSGFTLENIPSPVLSRATKMVAAAFSGHEYLWRIETSAELLSNEVLAFPVAKVLVSLINRLELYRLFGQMLAASVSKNLSAEKDEVLIDMASELKMDFDFTGGSAAFAKVGLCAYLRPSLEDVNAKLVNQKVEGGRVILSRAEFIRLVSMAVSQELRDSLPLKLKDVPAYLKSAADALDSEFSAQVRKQYSKSDFGAVAPESFPPCMAKIYSGLAAGLKVPHSARFAIATFLSSVGMSPDQIVNVFRATPNFSEATTRYHVGRIAGKGSGDGYSAPGCDKMRSYALCVANCPVSHPVQFYANEVGRGKAQAAVPVEEEK
ncbi:MAG TPA: hypothetical protein HA254_07320 [Candidatus Diapherotrites archaeon]|uniref:DNA primase large subunit PriL n=1 Tax=Candidatus Iainarchaeum sp. TaxID=3101447 RepID=A0A7J4J5E9_9ARCH|nr:hypothetical protein [Candidatus Diapherotrites archaeon]